MVESNKALIKHGRVTASTSYKELLKLDSDPNRKLYIREITITFSSVAGTPYIDITINGRRLLRDFRPVTTQTKLAFGGNLVFEGKTDKPPILIQVKDASATPDVTCFVTGVELPFTSKEP